MLELIQSPELPWFNSPNYNTWSPYARCGKESQRKLRWKCIISREVRTRIPFVIEIIVNPVDNEK